MAAAVVTPAMAAAIVTAAAAAIAAVAVGSDVITVPPAAVTDPIGFVIIRPVTVSAAISPAISPAINGAASRGQDKKAKGNNRP
jgi:hypothetical protein